MSAQKTKAQATKSIHAVSFDELGMQELEKTASPEVFAIWVRTLLQNRRQGTVKVKDRSEVALSGKKPFKQKGTGRARAGTARSPLWRGGGIVFGPQARVRKLTIPQKIKKQILATLLQARINNNALIILNNEIKGDTPKTAQAFSMLQGAGLHDHKVVLFIPRGDVLTYASFVNLPNVQLLFFDQNNAYDLANAEYWVVLRKDFEQFKKMVEQWT